MPQSRSLASQSGTSTAELEAELPDLRRTLAALGVAGEAELSAEGFLELLRRRATRPGCGNGSGPPQAPDLAAAIRRELEPLR